MKRTITFLVFILSAALIFGQGIIISDEIVFANFEGDPEDFGYSVVSVWGHSEHGITDNPEKSDLNNTDKAYKGIRNEGSWNAGVTIEWENPVLTEGRNFMSIMVFSEGYNAFVYLKIFNGDALLREGWCASGTPAQSNGQWAKAVLGIAGISQFDKIEVYLSNNWGGNQADQVAYFDELGMYKESYEYQGPYLDIVYEAKMTEEEMDIDGLDLEDIWIDANMEEFAAEEGTIVVGSWASVWNYEYLYFFFDVNVDHVHTWKDANWAEWKGDGFQVYMDVLSRRVDGRVFGNMNGFAVCPDLESTGAFDAGRGFRNYLPFGNDYRPLAAQGSIITGNGYTIEIALPWKGLAFAAGGEITDPEQWVAENVKPGLEIAIALQLNESDNTGSRTRVVNWLPEGGWNNSGNWAALKLAGDDTDVRNEIKPDELIVYPSAANNFINIKMNGLARVEIFDISGRLMKSSEAGNDKINLDISGLKNGMYIIRAMDGKISRSKKFIKM